MDIFIPIFAAVISNVIWGSTFMASKIILDGGDPLMITIARFLIATIALLVIGFFRKESFQISLLKQRFLGVISLGVVGYVGLYYFQMIALKVITSSQSASVMFFAPVITLILNSLILKRLVIRELVVIVVCFMGACLILVDAKGLDYSSSEIDGILLTFLASVCLGVSVIQTKNLMQPKENGVLGFSVFNVTFYSILVGFFGLVIVAFLENRLVALDSFFQVGVFGWLVYLGLICSVMAFLLWNWSIKYARPSIIAGAMYLKTPVALALGAYALSEKLSLVFYIGSFAILISLFLNQFLASRLK